MACGRELLKLLEPGSYDYLFTAEAKSIPLIHEMARQSGAKKYFIARKGPKAYMPDPIHVEDQSITTAGTQKLYLGRDDADLIRGKRIVLMDDVISTGGSLRAMERIWWPWPEALWWPASPFWPGRRRQAGGHQVPGSPAFVQRRRLVPSSLSPAAFCCRGDFLYFLDARVFAKVVTTNGNGEYNIDKSTLLTGCRKDVFV